MFSLPVKARIYSAPTSQLPTALTVIDTNRALQRLREAQTIQRTARLSRRANAVLEFAVSVVSLLLLAGFSLDLVNWSREHDAMSALLHRGADFLAAPFHGSLGYSTVFFAGGTFSPMYLIAAASYILVGLASSSLIRRLAR